MADMTDVVAKAVESASTLPDTDAAESSDDAATPDADTSADSAEPAETEVSTSEAVETPAPAAEVPASDPLIDELKALGVEVPVGKDGRMPNSRWKKMTAQYKEKLAAQHAADVKQWQEKHTAAERQHRELVEMAMKDPETNLRMLMEANPAYKDAVQKLLTATPAPVAAEPPPPDAQFPDGSVGYSQEGMGKLLAWNRQQAKMEALQEAKAAFTKEVGPIISEWKGKKAYEAALPGLQARIERTEKTWGKELVEKHQAEITTKMNEAIAARVDVTAPGYFEQVVADVLLPKIAADRTTMRADILKEMKAAPLAASRGVPGSTAAETNVGPRSIEQAIKEAVDAAKAAGVR